MQLSTSILGRGLLALQLKCGAEDIADGTKATVGSITSKNPHREYHHLFPASILQDANIPRDQIFRALNCALVTWRTNRTISNKDPVAYLKERADNSALGVDDLKRRLIPYKQLAVGYDGLSDDERRSQVKDDYALFLSTRAEILARAVQLACTGKALELSDLFKGGGLKSADHFRSEKPMPYMKRRLRASSLRGNKKLSPPANNIQNGLQPRARRHAPYRFRCGVPESARSPDCEKRLPWRPLASKTPFAKSFVSGGNLSK